MTPRDSACRTIVLIGMMGAGKSTLANLIRSEILRRGSFACRVWSSDQHVLKVTGYSSIREMFDSAGEAAFRAAEAAALLEELTKIDLPGLRILDLGGGAILSPSVQEALAAPNDAILKVWVDTPLDTIVERVTCGDDTRPLATDVNSLELIHSARRQHYANTADTVVDGENSHVAVSTLVDRIEQTRLFMESGCDALISQLIPEAGIAIVSDESVDESTAAIVDAMASSSRHKIVSRLSLPMGEWNKDLSTVESMSLHWQRCGLKRSDIVVAIGGGTLLDTAGFAASIWKRGVRWVAVPTTTLAQVDAGIGGKTGINFGGQKNQIGTFHEPSLTLIDPQLTVASGLAANHPAIAGGFSELTKTLLLAGVDPTVDSDAYDLSPSSIALCAMYKESITISDPEDKAGIRSQLNLGHTVAHAIEAETHSASSHAQSVAIGLHFALRASERLLGFDKGVTNTVVHMLEQQRLSTTTDIGWTNIERHLHHDKKLGQSGLEWVLMNEPGSPCTLAAVDPEVLREIWEKHIQIDAQDPAYGGVEAPHFSDPPRIMTLFGVNLGTLGHRSAEHYGSATLGQLIEDIREYAQESVAKNSVLEFRQTDDLRRFIACIQEAVHGGYSALIINPGAWTHYEYALRDAVEAFSGLVIEVHLSDIKSREEWRRTSVLSDVVDHTIIGEGAAGYRRALGIVAEQQKGIINGHDIHR